MSFASKDDYRPRGEIDLAFTNGVFHHIPPRERADAVSYVRDALRPGGLFALWENNPWNPATRLVISRCPFDRDAITLTPPEARRLLRDGGFDLLGTDFLFIFPRIMSWLRFLEPPLCRLPLGTQYLVLGMIRPSRGEEVGEGVSRRPSGYFSPSWSRSRRSSPCRATTRGGT